MKEFLSKNVEETAKIATDFGKQLNRINRKAPSAKATVVGLYGELGSGKTAFMKYLANFFGIKETIQSPTYVIMKTYKTSPPSPLSLTRRGGEENSRSLGSEVFQHLIHIDAYRIEKEDEMINLGWQEIISDPKNLICIEWPENISGIMPEHTMIKFKQKMTKEK